MSNRKNRMACNEPEQKKRSTTQMSIEEPKNTDEHDMSATTIQIDVFASGSGPQLSQEIQDRIGDQLRLLYDQVVDEDIPQSLLELVRRLEARKRG